MTQANHQHHQRLNKHLAQSLGISRRQADELISSGQVKINDVIVPLGTRFDASKDKVTVKGKTVKPCTKLDYILLNKPRNYVCSRKQQGSAPTIYTLLPEQLHHLKTVGRLDKDSSGLILLSNDGDFIQQMTHPSFYKNKNYLVTLDKPLEPLHQQMINDYGLQLEDGPSKLQLEKLNDNAKTWRVTMHEGRNRQIRRTFQALGYTVTKLHRTNFGKYELSDLARGQYKTVSKL